MKQFGAVNSARRTQRQADVAKFYAGFGDAVLWGAVARQIAAQRGTSLSANARAFALLNMALNDVSSALVASKWRPETAIRAAGSDGNPETQADAAFAPLIPTPCHPSYPSGHAATSHAAREILERAFGKDGYTLALRDPQAPDTVLTYSNLERITSDIDDARVYAGIHFRFDQVAGAEQGRRLAAHVYEAALTPVRPIAAR